MTINVIKNPAKLVEALNQLGALQKRRNALESKIEALRKLIVGYYEKNNKTQFEDETGNVWKKQQGSTVIYDDEGFKKLLARKGVPVEEVYKETTVEERDEQAISKLLSSKKISVKDWKKYAVIHYHSAYVRAYPPAKKDDEGEG